MPTTKRIAKWDNLKLFLIFTVVEGHIADTFYEYCNDMKSVFLFIYLFHMPAFIFLSGLFSKKTVDGNNYKKVLPYVTLYFATLFLRFVSSAVCYGTDSLPLFDSSGVPWFVFSLFSMNIITMYTKKFKPQWVLAASIILSIFAGYNYQNIDAFSIMRTINYYPFFYLGYILNREKLNEFLSRKKIKIISAVFIAAVFAVCFLIPKDIMFLRTFVTGRGIYSTLGDIAVWGGLIKIPVTAVTLALIMALISLTPSKEFKLSVLGSRTLGVYVVHYCFIDILFAIKPVTPAMVDMPAVLRQIIVLALSAVITLICSNKYFDAALKKIMDHGAKLKEK